MAVFLWHILLFCLLLDKCVCYHEYYTLYYNEDRPITVSTDISILNVSPTTESFVIHQPLEVDIDASSLEVLVTDSHFIFSKFSHFAQLVPEETFSIDEISVSTVGITSATDKCHFIRNYPIDINIRILTSVQNAELNDTKFDHFYMAGPAHLTLDLNKWKVEPFHYLYLMVAVTHDKSSKRDHFQQIYAKKLMFNIVSEFKIPLETDVMQPVEHVIANVFIVETNTTTRIGNTLSLFGLGMHISCFKDGNRILTNGSKEYEVKIKQIEDENFLHITVLFNLKFALYGRYQCVLDVLDQKRQKLFRLRSNKMACCSKEQITTYDKYLSFIGSVKLEELKYNSIEFSTTAKTIQSYVFGVLTSIMETSRTYIAIWATLNPILWPVVIISVLSVISMRTWKRITSRIESQRRNDLNQLEILKQLDPKPKPLLKYDIFISYSSHDRQFIEDVILKGLEKRGYKCCYDPRDFCLGTSIIQNIAEGIFSSHKTLAVFSKDYFRSRWCFNLEFTLTYCRVIDDSRPTDNLAVVEYKRCDMGKSLKEKNYIKWHDYKDEKKFLEDLSKILGPPRIKNLTNVAQ